MDGVVSGVGGYKDSDVAAAGSPGVDGVACDVGLVGLLFESYACGAGSVGLYDVVEDLVADGCVVVYSEDVDAVEHVSGVVVVDGVVGDVVSAGVEGEADAVVGEGVAGEVLGGAVDLESSLSEGVGPACSADLAVDGGEGAAWEGSEGVLCG